MSNGKSIRNRRYNLKTRVDVTLVVQAVSGELFDASITNVSLNGISAEIPTDFSEKFQLTEHQILPSAKIKWQTNELAVGRMVIKKISQKTEATTLGLMLIDSRLPIESTLSRVLDIDLSEEINDANNVEMGPDDVNLSEFLGKSLNYFDIFTKAKRYHIFHEKYKRTARWGYFIPRKPSKGTRINLQVPREDGRDDFIIMASNDYLGISSRDEVCEAAKKAIDKYGFGSTGSAVTVGQTEEHENLEEKLARIFRCESALLFNSGYAANVGAISGIVGPEDLVVADILSHASIYDGMQLSPGTKRFFIHNNMDHLEKILKRSRDEAAGALIVVEGVFSMDGDSANLTAIKSLAQQYACRIMIDEAHSFGILGPQGFGLAEECGLLGGMDLTMGTFSKICGGIGGFITGSKEIINWMKISARSGFFSVSLPPSNVAAASAALDIFMKEPQLLVNLRKNIDHFTSGLRRNGFKIAPNHKSAIIPVIIGDEQKMGKMYKILYNAGVYTIPVVYPAVSKNNCRFRFTMSTSHTVSDIDYALFVLKRAAEEVGLDLGSKDDQLKAG